MNLVGTLAKVAMGVLVARGVGKLVKGKAGGGMSGGGSSSGGGGLDDLLGGIKGSGNLGSGSDRSSQSQGGVSLEDLLEGVKRGSAGQQQSSGGPDLGGLGGLGGILGKVLGAGKKQQSDGGLGLDDLLDGLKRGGAPKQSGGGGLDDLLESIKRGGASQQQSGGSGGMGGLGDILGKVLSGAGGKGGGLGGILDSLGAGGPQPHVDTQPRPNSGSLGDLLNQVLGGKKVSEPAPDQNAQAEIILRGMINAAKADHQIDEGEQSKILDNLGDVSQDEINFVRNEMAQPLDIHKFIRSVPKGMEQQVYMMSLLAITLDTRAEAEYMDHLAQGLGISHQVANQIHAQVGAPNIYS